MSRHVNQPQFKVGDRATIVDYGVFGDSYHEIVLAITDVFANYGGAGIHRYYGDTTRGPRGAYEYELQQGRKKRIT